MRMRELQRARAKVKAREAKLRTFWKSDGDVVCSVQWLEAYFSADGLFIEEFGMRTFEEVFGMAGRDAGDAAAVDPETSTKWPVLGMMLFASVMVQGKRRKTATLTVLAEDGMVKIGLRDRDRNVSLWVSGKGLLEAMDALEKALNASPVAWRRMDDTWQTRGRQRPA